MGLGAQASSMGSVLRVLVIRVSKTVWGCRRWGLSFRGLGFRV